MLEVIREFLGYSPHSKACKVFYKRTMCIEENVHVVFDESNQSIEKNMHNDDQSLI